MCWLTTMGLVQGVYFALTWLWPFVSMRTFERVTGPKPEQWLVRTVGWLVLVIGGVLLLGAAGGSPPSEVVVLGIASAAALAGVDTNYVLRGRIARIYLLDAVVEALIIIGWLVALMIHRPA
jgi:hypothetical protein